MTQSPTPTLHRRTWCLPWNQRFKAAASLWTNRFRWHFALGFWTIKFDLQFVVRVRCDRHWVRWRGRWRSGRLWGWLHLIRGFRFHCHCHRHLSQWRLCRPLFCSGVHLWNERTRRREGRNAVGGGENVNRDALLLRTTPLQPTIAGKKEFWVGKQLNFPTPLPIPAPILKRK